nr:DUF1045 domain-containing protein [Agrobacterium vitis]
MRRVRYRLFQADSRDRIAVRYALYFTPPKDDPLTLAAKRWLGRDAFTGADLDRQPVEGFSDDEITALTADPRRYGFHATLKAPFSLKEGESEAALLEMFSRFCKATPAFEIPKVVVNQLGPFFAVVPDSAHQPLQDFAASVVEAFEPFRAPLSEADIIRRKPENLSERKRALLETWGYPYVMEEFRFHMTLTGPVDAERSDAMRAVLENRFADFTNRALPIGGLGLFVEPSRNAPFTVHRWLPLAGSEGSL